MNNHKKEKFKSFGEELFKASEKLNKAIKNAKKQ